MNFSKQEYTDLMLKAEKEAVELLNAGGYENFHKEKAISKIENLIWELAVKYVNDEISPEVFECICYKFNEGEEFYQMSGWAMDLISSGTEITYDLYLNPIPEDPIKNKNFAKLMIKKHFEK